MEDRTSEHQVSAALDMIPAGRIWTSRNAGSGTTFHFTLDAAPSLPSAPRLHVDDAVE
jgi:hypothetical protein